MGWLRKLWARLRGRRSPGIQVVEVDAFVRGAPNVGVSSFGVVGKAPPSGGASPSWLHDKDEWESKFGRGARCSWNPARDRMEDWDPDWGRAGCNNKAIFLVGKGERAIKLCPWCARLPRFRAYSKRRIDNGRKVSLEQVGA